MGQIKYNNLDDLFYIKGEYFLEKEIGKLKIIIDNVKLKFKREFKTINLRIIKKILQKILYIIN